VVNTLNVEMYVIGGGVASAWDAFAPTMFAEVQERSIVYAATDPEAQPSGPQTPGTPKQKKSVITRALLGSDAGLFGAAKVPLMQD
jgi:glucokinase